MNNVLFTKVKYIFKIQMTGINFTNFPLTPH